MKKQYVSESPEWKRLYWAVMVVVAWVVLSSLFSCESQINPHIKRMDEFIAQYWYVVLILSVGCFGLYRWRRNKLHAFFAWMFLIFWAMPYMMMFGLWVILQLIP